MVPVCARVGVLASLATGCAFPALANAQIFGEVRPNGMVILTNIGGEAHEAGMKVIVADSTDAGPTPAPNRENSDTSKFAEVIAEASRKWNVRPELLRAVIAVESAFNPNAVSKRGARGLMQLMPEIARRFAVDNVFDPRANVLAGAQYLRALLDTFDNDVELALAAYNAGEQSVIKAGYRIPAIPETRAYVPAVMARYRRLISG